MYNRSKHSSVHMTRLFLTLVTFLVVSLTGLWYSFTGQKPIGEVAYENESITIPAKEQNEEQIVSESIIPKEEQNKSPSTLEGTSSSSVIPQGEVHLVDSPSPSMPTLASSVVVVDHLLHFGYRTPPSPRHIDTIVLHSSYNALEGDSFSVEKVIQEYEHDGVGAHYLIDRSGKVYRLVRESDTAYHAGVSKMPDGRKNVNDFSIGIEMIATEESGFTESQYKSVRALIADIKSRYEIDSVVGHSDIAPSRKTDPWKFDWNKLK